jgi:hypothetical protein
MTSTTSRNGVLARFTSLGTLPATYGTLRQPSGKKPAAHGRASPATGSEDTLVWIEHTMDQA